MVYRKGVRFKEIKKNDYNGKNIEIVKKITNLGVVFTTGGSFMETH